MAAVVRVRLGQYTRKCVHSILLQLHTFKTKQRVCFHNSGFLYVIGQELKMPSLSPTMSEGTIVKWMKKEGDAIVAGDVICDIQTDKAIISLETEEEGILAKILVPENTKDIPVGQVIALLVGEGEDWKSVEAPGGSSPPASSSPPSSGAPPPQQVAEGTVTGQELKMPSLSPTMSEGTIVKWLKKEGDRIAPGDAICDIQTDKAIISLETEEEGILAKILPIELRGVAEDEQFVSENSAAIPVGQTIALIVGEGEDWKSVGSPKDTSSPSPASSGTAPKASSSSSSLKSPINFGPAVRLLLEQYGIEASQVLPTGPKGTLLKDDVLKYIAKNNLQPKSIKQVPLPSKSAAQHGDAEAKPKADKQARPVKKSGPGYLDIEMSSMRKTIARRLTESKNQIPHAYGYADCVIDKVVKMRKQLKEDGIAVSLNDFVIKAVALALQTHPKVNTHVIGDQVTSLRDIDISVAVTTDAGLITPIIKNAIGKGLVEISAVVRDLATRAREGKLQLHEFQGGSFTISNLGMFGVKEFSAIINPPQTAILAVGGGRKRLGVDGMAITKMTITLSYDRRAIAEDEAAEFLETVKGILEEPQILAMGLRNHRMANAL
uniref:Dihydrolipoamide acetyltransferase component of pyruvate dehydrogenase complex n=1 Tax=Timema monikensis TaxID=170555 RepID=A0A7R9EEF8_9NEOP|nr:unnamed protein product [Timema monikensis]